MNNCPECNKLWKKWLATGNMWHSKGGITCLDCKIEDANADLLKAKKLVNELIEQKIERN